MAHLKSVDGHFIDPDETRDTDPVHTTSTLPAFEGEEVLSARFRLAAVSNLEAPDDDPVRIDDVVRMYVEGRVVRIDHVVDDKTGNLIRVQSIKVVDAIKLPTDFDTGTFES